MRELVCAKMNPCDLSDSELRDLIEKRGTATHSISDRATLERMYTLKFTGVVMRENRTDGPDSYGLSDPRAAKNVPLTSQEGGTNAIEDNMIDDDHLDDQRRVLQQLEAAVQVQRRIKQLRDEMAQLGFHNFDNITANAQPAVQRATDGPRASNKPTTSPPLHHHVFNKPSCSRPS